MMNGPGMDGGTRPYRSAPFAPLSPSAPPSPPRPPLPPPPVPLADGSEDLYILAAKYWKQFAADVPQADAIQMAATQRPITKAGLGEPTGAAGAWKTLPSWFVFGDEDRNIPAAALRFQAERAGARTATEVVGASHAISVSRPEVVAELIATAHAEVSATAAA